jgi:RHS repeat-associated protein
MTRIAGGTSNTYFYCMDGNGNVVDMVDADGNNVAHYDYGPFGETLVATGPMVQINPFRFSTKYTDNESGLVHYGYRYYSSELGRFISKDPIEESGGKNLYVLLRNNAVCLSDYLGMFPESVGDAGECCASDINKLIKDHFLDSELDDIKAKKRKNIRRWTIEGGPTTEKSCLEKISCAKSKAHDCPACQSTGVIGGTYYPPTWDTTGKITIVGKVTIEKLLHELQHAKQCAMGSFDGGLGEDISKTPGPAECAFYMSREILATVCADLYSERSCDVLSSRFNQQACVKSVLDAQVGGGCSSCANAPACGGYVNTVNSTFWGYLDGQIGDLKKYEPSCVLTGPR